MNQAKHTGGKTLVHGFVGAVFGCAAGLAAGTFLLYIAVMGLHTQGSRHDPSLWSSLFTTVGFGILGSSLGFSAGVMCSDSSAMIAISKGTSAGIALAIVAAFICNRYSVSSKPMSVYDKADYIIMVGILCGICISVGFALGVGVSSLGRTRQNRRKQQETIEWLRQ